MSDRLVLYGASFATNAVILIFEITGGRLLAPYLGTSVEVWSGIIGVVLGGMAFGYWFGGIIGDRNSSRGMISAFLVGAGAAALLSWGMRDLAPTMFIGSDLPLTLLSVIVAGILFVPTVVLLAAVSPLIAKNLIRTVDDSAKVVGTLNAVGTLGSILGAVGTGVLLIPFFGVSAIMLALAVAILLIALLVGGTSLARSFLFVVFAAGIAGALSIFPTRATVALADVSTAYNRIWVDSFEYNGLSVRTVSMDPFGTQCAMLVDEDGIVNEEILVFPYVKGFDIVANNTLGSIETPRALFLGGCNYSFPRTFLAGHAGASGDAVEIDPGMTRVAEQYFGLDRAALPSLSIIHEDARMFLNRDNGLYDIIFMDTFGSQSGIPQHLTTQETSERLRIHLADDGVLAINVIGAVEGEKARFTAALLSTARTAFPDAALYSFSSDPTVLQNLLIVASPSRTFPETLTDPQYPDVVLTKLSESDLPESSIILTDDFAPVESLTRSCR